MDSRAVQIGHSLFMIYLGVRGRTLPQVARIAAIAFGVWGLVVEMTKDR